jgi:pyruvate, orthophosphate dikinase
MKKYVYNFGDGIAEGDASLKEILGGKGANLAQMSKLGIPVPLGFTISTEICNYFYSSNKQYPHELYKQVEDSIDLIERKLGLKLGDDTNPLLVSVRSGARVSMPGMMDTILNLGLNDKTVIGLAKNSNDYRFAYDCYRRFIQMYASVVMEVDHFVFEEIISHKKLEKNYTEDNDFKAEDLQEIILLFKQKILEETDKEFPQNVHSQLWAAINAVFNSWNCNRAITYRKINNIPGEWGTAVNIQSMVFGNMGADSATGVAFTRNPVTGVNEIFGEYLINAQGEDVVAGIRTPANITNKGKVETESTLPSLEEEMPAIFKQFKDIAVKLESNYKDMQDIEFTIQKQKLWILQTRSGKRTAKAAMRIAVDLVKEKKISEQDALCNIDPMLLDQILHPSIDPNADKIVIARGLPASPGAASGKVVFSAEDAERLSEHYKLILVRTETSPEDIHGMHAAQGILTSRGGMTSHAAVVARGMGKCCIVGAGSITVDYKNKVLISGNTVVKEGEIITLNGSTGEIMLGEVATMQPSLSADFTTIMAWANKYRSLKVRANAETEEDSKTARKYGAEGIGLCRTEHMFFEENRIMAVREMILSNDQESRELAINKILPYQKDDFINIFRVMQGLPVNIRLLDPPLHEFLPHSEQEIEAFAKAVNMPLDHIRNRIYKLKEQNPMLGHRGCRLGISYPEIYEMQAKAIFEAMIEVNKTTASAAIVEIMVPLVTGAKEFGIIKSLIEKVANEVKTMHKIELNYEIGTMIELPSAALVADEIAKIADYFSFGTNDLTQTTLGISRDDSSSFMQHYINYGIFSTDPFVRIEENTVGKLVEKACVLGKGVNSKLKLGVCGEHGGDPFSISFFNKVGLDYVSCSPYRVPIAILSAAQASIRQNKDHKNSNHVNLKHAV